MNEGAVKDKVKKLLKRYEPLLWYYMPVSNGMGVMGIPDFVCCYDGMFMCIETKRPGRRGEANGGLSALQVRVRRLIETAGGKYFVVDDDISLKGVEEWLSR